MPNPLAPQKLSREEIAAHVARIDGSPSEDRDALLTMLLVHVYPTSALQEG